MAVGDICRLLFEADAGDGSKLPAGSNVIVIDQHPDSNLATVVELDSVYEGRKFFPVSTAFLDVEPGVIRWTTHDSEQASSRGWDIFSRPPREDGCILELQRIDDDSVFENDYAAWMHVRCGAAVGDALATKALNFLYYRSPKEYRLVMDYLPIDDPVLLNEMVENRQSDSCRADPDTEECVPASEPYPFVEEPEKESVEAVVVAPAVCETIEAIEASVDEPVNVVPDAIVKPVGYTDAINTVAYFAAALLWCLVVVLAGLASSHSPSSVVYDVVRPLAFVSLLLWFGINTGISFEKWRSSGRP